MGITVFGSVNVDLTAYVEHLPQPGVTVHAKSLAKRLGGKGANQAVATQRLSRQSVDFIGAIGDDAFGQEAAGMLSDFGLSTDNLRTFSGQQTGVAVIHVDEAAQNSITVVGGANMAWSADQIDSQALRNSDLVLLQLEVPLPALEAALKSVKDVGTRVILDPAPVPSGEALEALLKLLPFADFVTPNESEATALTGVVVDGRETAEHAAQWLCAAGVGTAVVKLGDKGVVYADQKGRQGFIPPYDVEAVDTVAAGDCFNGGLAAALSDGADLQTALSFAAAAGALAVTKRGAAVAAPTREQVIALQRRQTPEM